MLKKCSFFACFLDEKCEVLSGEWPAYSPCVRSKHLRVYVQNVPCVPVPRAHVETHVERAIKRQSSSSMSKRSCSKGGKCSFEQDMAKKGTCKGNRSKGPVKGGNSAERPYARKIGKSPSGKKMVLRVSDRECDDWHLPHCKYSKKNTCDVGEGFPFTVKSANHRLRDTSEKLLQFETSTNTHLKSEETSSKRDDPKRK